MSSISLPRCGNHPPYCQRSDVICVKETNREFVFLCRSCQGAQIIMRPEFRQAARQRALDNRGPLITEPTRRYFT